MPLKTSIVPFPFLVLFRTTQNQYLFRGLFYKPVTAVSLKPIVLYTL